MTVRPAPIPALVGTEPYRVPRHPAPIDLHLDGNEGLPAPRDLLTPLAGADPDLGRRYPGAEAADLEARLAARHGVAPERVLCTAGADDALDRACRALLAPGRSLVLPAPTFEMLARYARLVGAEVRELPWFEGPYPTDAVIEAADATSTLVAVVSPNNPTGAVASPGDLERLSAALPASVLLVDLAYGEFADADLTAAALALPNALVFRTLSKAWGLAGLRVGYVIGPPDVIGWLRAAGAPYPVSGPSLWLAARRLDEGSATVEAFIHRVRQERAELATRLTALGARPLPSQANFVLARVADPLWLRDGLAGVGIAVRIFPDHRELGECVRVTCPGEPAAFARLLAGLQATLAPATLVRDLAAELPPGTAGWAVVKNREEIGRARAAGLVPMALAAPGTPEAAPDAALQRAGAARVHASIAQIESHLAITRAHAARRAAPGDGRGEQLRSQRGNDGGPT